MRSLLIIGTGSFSSEMEELAILLGYSDIAFLDDNPDFARCYMGFAKEQRSRAENEYC